MAVRSAATPATLADLEDRTDRDRLEIVGRAIVEKAAPSAEHSTAEFQLGAMLGPFARRGGGDGPGGWRLTTEIHIAYERDVHCHDLAGWRRERVPERPKGWPVRLRPDWVCEIASPSHEKRDFVDKLAVLHGAGVPHYWILHPEQEMLLVHRWTEAGYVTVVSASSGQRVGAEPFEAIELPVDLLFGDEPAS